MDNRERFFQVESPFVQKLASDLKAKDVMTYNVITLAVDQKVKQAKEIMRLKKISGLPIIDEKNRVVGIISIDDIIRWLEEQDPEGEIGRYMTRNVVTVREDQLIIEILKMFKRYKYGRFPVVNNENVLTGIITPGDVLIKFLHILEEHMSSRSPELVRKKVKGFEKDLKFDNRKLVKLSFEIEGGDLSQAGEASSQLKSILAKSGRYSDDFLRKVAIVSYEAEVNVVIHAYRGVMTAFISPDFVKIVVADEGPGIVDIELALQPGWSTASEQVRELGFGAGMGLYNMKRWADDLMIESVPGKGTIITAIIYNRKGEG
ncbi:hypothetical protein BBF96_07885 [Anoxybacter fermentans]|uniref:CBS domain-containing protein n=1 Tax=Anoxybacter fermentans TaxID=1323375 RepID=A0A3Q9HSP0_9FIRM|nr:hypothetical protein BBF96_07885 [Anoxybacter fermentans]